MKKYCIEVAHFLKLGIIHGFRNIVTSFLLYVLDHTQAFHLNNRPAPPSQPLSQSYIPNKGCTYYFTPVVTNYVKCQLIMLVVKVRIPIMMIIQKLTEHAIRNFLVFLVVDLDTFSCGFVQFMVILMVSI